MKQRIINFLYYLISLLEDDFDKAIRNGWKVNDGFSFDGTFIRIYIIDFCFKYIKGYDIHCNSFDVTEYLSKIKK